MDKSFLLEAIDPLPMLLWDTVYPVKELAENRPFRNIGDMLIKRSPVNREALRLCGCDPAILNGEASDYEGFAALCMATPMLLGHRSAIDTELLLKTVFGLEMPLSPYQTQELWTFLNEIIEDRTLRPSDVAEALHIESLCYRHHPLAPVCRLTFGTVDLYPIFDLSEPLATLAAIRSSDGGFDSAVQILTDRLAAFLSAGCVSVRIALPKPYRFARNSRKKEVDDLLLRLTMGKHLSIEEENQLLTALLISLSVYIIENGLVLLLATEAEECELIALYNYWNLNHITPEALLVTPRPWQYQDLFSRHTCRTAKGLPSLFPITEDFTTMRTSFPLGAGILPCGDIRDTVSLTEGLYQRSMLIKALASYEAPPDMLNSLAEDIVYGNIKNRFAI